MANKQYRKCLCNNDQKIITKYYNKPTYIKKFILSKLSLRYEKICFYLIQKNRLKKIVFDFKNIFLLLNSLSNLVSLGLLSNNKIYHNNKNKILYNIDIKKILV